MPKFEMPVPAVSVMMDVSRGGAFLDQALSSLAAQTFTDFEIVLLAHGADAPTEAVVRDWEPRERRMRVLRAEKMPLARAHNFVARACTAPLLARLDADDLALPDRLERQVAMFAADPGLGFAGGAIEVVDSANRPQAIVRNPLSHTAIAAALAESCPIVHSTLMVRADAFWKAGAYRQGMNISEDYDLYCRLAEVTRAGNLRDILVRYRVHKSSLTSSRVLRMAISNEVVRASRLARARSQDEPFANGTPCLRKAALIVGRTRGALRVNVYAIARQSSFSRRLLTGWLPSRIRGWVRAVAIGLGLRPVYAATFRLVQKLAEMRSAS